ncbi:MAG TPA: SpoIID/LytB domain-containing protein [Myxococcota bacterium]|nr:SpoIID/LytB domain-containing protein [Myxococcota bacterium]
METDAHVEVRDPRPGGFAATLEPGRSGLLADARAVGRKWRIGADGVVAVDRNRYRGEVEFLFADGRMQVINEVSLEAYVAGILGREIYPGWAPETFKAQAVVARTYALHQRAARGRRGFDVEADTSSQVYGGAAAETPAIWAAVSATRGEYIAYAGEPILAAYHSASGGQTASAEEVWGSALPYLVSVEVADEEDSPDTYWRATIPKTKLGRALGPLGIGVGTARELELEVVARTDSGRASRVRIRGSHGDHTLEARALRAALGESVIRSTLFEVRPGRDAFVFVGSGHGHGVGMSQWGAEAMAQRGASYREILATFYPGTTLLAGAPR